MPYIILIPAHGLGKFISYLGVCHYITKTHLGGQDTLQGTLEPVGLRKGSDARALVVPFSVDLERRFEPVEGQASYL
jgi:hypothetical protein